jgi:hypothetical protein
MQALLGRSDDAEEVVDSELRDQYKEEKQIGF